MKFSFMILHKPRLLFFSFSFFLVLNLYLFHFLVLSGKNTPVKTHANTPFNQFSSSDNPIDDIVSTSPDNPINDTFAGQRHRRRRNGFCLFCNRNCKKWVLQRNEMQEMGVMRVFRFSCLSREYKYLFWRENLNVLAMESAGKKFVGEHDFRNFCKMDAVNVHNYRRNIKSFEISPCNKRFEGNQLWAMKIKGSAFLWHQVRCMVAVLFMIGQGLESPDVIDALLDTDRTPRKPQYTMAPEIPLILQSCEFDALKFTCSSDARQALCAHLKNECRTYQLQAGIFDEALLSCLPSANDQGSLDNGMVKKAASHVPLMSRPTEPSYAERRAKLNSRT